jgi:hypothetical protein
MQTEDWINTFSRLVLKKKIAYNINKAGVKDTEGKKKRNNYFYLFLHVLFPK